MEENKFTFFEGGVEFDNLETGEGTHYWVISKAIQDMLTEAGGDEAVEEFTGALDKVLEVLDKHLFEEIEEEDK